MPEPDEFTRTYFLMPTKPTPKLKRLPPKKRPRKAKAGSRGSAAGEAVLKEISGDALVAKAAIEKPAAS